MSRLQLLQIAKSSKLHVLVVILGANYRKDYSITEPMKKSANIISNFINEIHENPWMIWRNALPGHGGCDDNKFGNPIGRIEEAELLVSTYNKDCFWEEFSHQKQLVEPLPIVLENGFKVLDVCTDTVTR